MGRCLCGLFGIGAKCGKYVGLGAVGEDAAVVHHDHPVNQVEQGRAVGDHNQGLALGGAVQMLKELCFGLRIHRAGGFIHQQQARAGKQGAGQRNQLTLTAGYAVAILADGQVDTARMRGGKLVQTGQSQYAQEFVDGGIRADHCRS